MASSNVSSSGFLMFSKRHEDKNAGNELKHRDIERVIWQASDSEADADETEIGVAHRFQTMMFTFAMPRQYPSNRDDRKKEKCSIPTDFSREEMRDNMKEAFGATVGAWILKEMIVAREPHKKKKPDGSDHEYRFHVIFKTVTAFAHKRITDFLQEKHGISGKMSRPRNGWMGMVKYVLEPCALRLRADDMLDATPLFWPAIDASGAQWTRESKLAFHRKELRESGTQATFATSRSAHGPNESLAFEHIKKRARTLDFVEFVSWVRFANVKNETHWWQLVHKQCNQGDFSLLNYSAQINVGKKLKLAIAGTQRVSMDAQT